MPHGRKHIVRTLAYKDAVPISDPADAYRQTLQQPIGTPPLSPEVTSWTQQPTTVSVGPYSLVSLDSGNRR